MSERQPPTYRYLSGAGDWPGFRFYGATVEDGAIRLPPIPASAVDVHTIEQATEQLAGAARIGVAPDGAIYIADPARNAVLRVDCAGGRGSLTCVAPAGTAPGEFRAPRGVIVGPRGLVYVADTGNHRIQVLVPATGTVVGVWGQPDPWRTPTASSNDGRFDHPWDLAADAHNRVYVADPGSVASGTWQGGRIQRFDATGRVEPAFWSRMRGERLVPGAAAGIVVVTADDASERLLVLDAQPPRVLVYRLDGTLDDDETARWGSVAEALAAAGGADPVGVTWTPGALYVADAAHGRVLVFDTRGAFVASVRTPTRSVAGLAVDAQGRLLVHPGGPGGVARLSSAGHFADEGMFVAGPFEVGGATTAWFSLAARLDPAAQRGDTGIRLFSFTSDSRVGPDESATGLRAVVEMPDADRADGLPAPLDTWYAGPHDAARMLTLNAPGRYLWIAGVLRGDGWSTSSITQIRVDFTHPGWLQRMPALYASDLVQRRLLERMLALFEAELGDDQRLIDDLPLLFDAATSPIGDANSSWLGWLAGWLDLDLDETWNEQERRDAVRGAFALFGWRGTVAGVRRLVRMYTGADARISEPAETLHPWILGRDSVLGAGTMLAAAEPQGAVVGTTATLDHSHLITDAEYGRPLFDATAHRFVVELYAAQVADRTNVERVRAVLDREKPAHTDYHLCVIEPRMRVGYQARVGIDTIVGGPAGPLLDSSRRLGIDTMTAGSRRAAIVGDRSRVGVGAGSTLW